MQNKQRGKSKHRKKNHSASRNESVTSINSVNQDISSSPSIATIGLLKAIHSGDKQDRGSERGRRKTEKDRRGGGSEKEKLSITNENDNEHSSYAKLHAYERKLRDYEKFKEEKKRQEGPKEMRPSQSGSVFEPICGPKAPARSGLNGVKNKMKWKIDVEPVELRGDQQMPKVLQALKELRKSHGLKKCKVLKANEKTPDDDPQEELIHLSAQVLQYVKLEPLISKEVSKDDQEILRGYCRCGDNKDKAETVFEALAISILEKMTSKNEFIRNAPISGKLKIFVVDEKRAKLPLIALMMARKDLFYHAWTKAIPDNDEQLDSTWSSMAGRAYHPSVGLFSKASQSITPPNIKSPNVQSVSLDKPK